MRRLLPIALLLLLGVVGLSALSAGAFPGSAGAAKCLTCEEEGGGEVEAQFLTIEIVGKGSVSNGTTSYCQNTTSGSKVCEVELAEGKKVTLSAAASGEYVFQGWSGDCSGSGNCEVTMTEAKSVKATFTNPAPAAPTISSPTNGQVFERAAEEPISVSFSDSDPTIVGFRCSVDFGSSTSCTSPWKTPALSAGEHTVIVSAVDGANNLSSTARAFKVVINAPPAEEGGGGEEGEEPPKEEGGSGSGGGGTPGSTGATASTPPPPSVAPAIVARPVVRSHLLGKATVLRKLALKGLPAGAKVAATCKGKGCPFKRKQVKVVGGTADLSTLFAKHQLAPGALIELKATAPGMTGETIDVKTRAGKAPKVTTS